MWFNRAIPRPSSHMLSLTHLKREDLQGDVESRARRRRVTVHKNLQVKSMMTEGPEMRGEWVCPPLPRQGG